MHKSFESKMFVRQFGYVFRVTEFLIVNKAFQDAVRGYSSHAFTCAISEIPVTRREDTSLRFNFYVLTAPINMTASVRPATMTYADRSVIVRDYDQVEAQTLRIILNYELKARRRVARVKLKRFLGSAREYNKQRK
jgi:hypothetical protein